MAAAGATYGWVHAFQDDPMFVTGLWDTTATYLKARNISQACVQRWVPQRKLWRETPMCFATNFFVARRAWFASETTHRLLATLTLTPNP